MSKGYSGQESALHGEVNGEHSGKGKRWSDVHCQELLDEVQLGKNLSEHP